ncbi:glycosylhydrolase-like jelly roll fold domain-containing protein [Kribbella sp. NPDC051620]|uniref:glycosylhydrolase-like jelly roll fold domain-containing protein n=1 Tax=Kribbella sp. NPDC051620 TaxID=3364120 RepID=UPI003794B1B9
MTDQTSGGIQLSRRAVLAAAGAVAAVASMPSVAGATAAGHGFDPGRFINPPADSLPMVLWFWNGTVTTALVDQQLADLRDKGVVEVLVFPFETDALRPVFFSEEWFTLIEHTLREAERHGMHLWLFNDDFFPSGRGGGFVVKGGKVGDRVYQPRPELRLQGIVRGGATVDGGSAIPLDRLSRGLEVRDGRLVVDASRRDGITLLREGADWQDYAVTATVRIERATAGLMFRCPDEASGYLADLRSDGGLDIWRQSNGSFNLLSGGAALPGFDPAADHTLAVQVQGNRISASVDGTQRPDVVDGTWPRGRVGVRATATQLSSWDRLTVAGLYDEDFTSLAALDAFDLPIGFPGPLVAVAARPAGSSDVTAIRDLTAIAKAGEPWTAPPGRWQVDVFTSRALIDDGGFRQYYLDLLDDEAVALFLDIVPGEYLRRFPWAVGGVLRGFADDEPFLASASAHFRAIPWSPSLAGELIRLGAGSVAAALSAVHDDLGPAGQRLSATYWRAVSNRFAAAYYKQQGRWMADRGTAFISNPLWDEFGPAEQLKSSGNLNSTNQWAQIPGTDLIADHYQQGYYRTLSRYPASTAHQVGQERVYLEAMGAAGWTITPGQVRQAIGSFAVRGVNKTLLHAAFSDERTIFYPPPFQPVNPWWSVSEPLYQWIGRVMEAGRAQAAAETGLLQPQRGVEAVQGTPQAAALDSAFVAAIHALEDAQIDFDLVDEGALDQDPALIVHAVPRDGVLKVGRQSYRTVVIPPTPVIALGSVKTLLQFVRCGGSVVLIGPPATSEARGADKALATAWAELRAAGRVKQVTTSDEAAAAAVRDGRAAVSLTPPTPEVRVLRFRKAGELAFLVVNERPTPVTLTAAFPAVGVPEIWDADTGRAAPAPIWQRKAKTTELPLALDPSAAVLIVFKPGKQPAHVLSSTAPVESLDLAGRSRKAVVRVATPGVATVTATDGHRVYRGSATATDPLQALPLEGPWEFRFDRAGAETLQRPLGSWTDLDSGFAGAGVYQKDFVLDAGVLAGRSWTLDLGTVHEVAEVSINGTALPARLWAPYRVEVTAALRPGRNVVAVRVTNTGANSHGQSIPSGLLGPVSLQPQRLLTIPLESS